MNHLEDLITSPSKKKKKNPTNYNKPTKNKQTIIELGLKFIQLLIVGLNEKESTWLSG